MNTTKSIDIEKYISLHYRGVPLSKVKPIDDQTFITLKSSNVDVRIVDRDKNISTIQSLETLSMFSKDTEDYSHRFFYSIPLQTVSGTIVGFIYRTVFGKSYVTVTRDFNDKNCKVPIMFGFYKDFEDFDTHEDCKPIIVCEGLKDAITLKKIYPYVVSNNTSHMGLNLQVLSNLTNKFILIYDNDKAGEEGMTADVSRVQKLKYNIVKMKLSHRYKDITDCSEDKELFNKMSDYIMQAVDSLDKENKDLVALGRTNLVRR